MHAAAAVRRFTPAAGVLYVAHRANSITERFDRLNVPRRFPDVTPREIPRDSSSRFRDQTKTIIPLGAPRFPTMTLSPDESGAPISRSVSNGNASNASSCHSENEDAARLSPAPSVISMKCTENRIIQGEP